MDGILLIDKPEGWTSFDVCNKVRHLSLTKKVGHSGTLDPFATGLLIVFLGKATKSIQYFQDGDKEYIGEMLLGEKRDTGDVTGKILNSKSEIRNNDQISKSKLEEVFAKYIGEIEQVPPMYSAISINGQRLYKLARKGIEIERKARKINIYDLRLIGERVIGLDASLALEYRKIEDGQTSNNTFPTSNPLPFPNPISFYVSCSKGTYIRQLVIDIGDDLGCGAYLSKLRRTASHPFRISQALTMDAIINLGQIGKLETVLLPTEDFINIC